MKVWKVHPYQGTPGSETMIYIRQETQALYTGLAGKVVYKTYCSWGFQLNTAHVGFVLPAKKLLLKLQEMDVKKHKPMKRKHTEKKSKAN